MSIKNLKFTGFLFLLFLFLIIHECSHFIPSSDLWWHLGVGRFIWHHHLIPTQECFSYTAPGCYWLNHSWLADVIFFLIYSTGNLDWLQLFKILVIGASFALMLLLSLKQKYSLGASLTASCLALLCAQGNMFFDVRPYIFTYLFGALFYFILDSANRNRNLLLLLPPLMLVWVNLHGGFLVGFFLLAAFLFDTGWKRLRNESSDFLYLSIIFIMCLLITGLNPASFDIWKIFMGSKDVSVLLNEWVSPLSIGWIYPYYGYLLLVILGFFLTTPKTVRGAIIILFFGGLSLSSIRHVPLFAILTIPQLAGFFNFMVNKLDLKFPKLLKFSRSKIITLMAIALLFIYGGLFFRNYSLSSHSMEWELFPHDGVEFLNANNFKLKIFNPYEWGGYFILKAPRYPVFIDGRVNTAYPDQIYYDALKIMFGEKGWDKILKRYGIELVVCNLWQLKYGQLLPLKMKQNPEWQIIYHDPLCIIFLNKHALQKLTKPIYYPRGLYTCFSAGITALRAGKLTQAENYLQEALKIYPRYSPALINLGYIAMLKGNETLGIKFFRQAIIIDPQTTSAHYNIGKYYQAKGNKYQARQEFKKELKVNPNFEPAQRALKEVGP